MAIFDGLVAPWAAQALGEELPVLAYDQRLSRLQAVQLGECRVPLAVRGGHESPARGLRDPLLEIHVNLKALTDKVNEIGENEQ